MKKKKKKKNWCYDSERIQLSPCEISVTLSRSLIGSQALLNNYSITPSSSSYLSILHLSYFEINTE